LQLHSGARPRVILRRLQQIHAASIVRYGAIGSAVLLYSTLLVFLRGRPRVSCVTGIFLKVGTLMLRGYHLYSGVSDNKPPLFYYDYALGIFLAGWRGPLLLDAVWVAVACMSCGALVRHSGASRFVTTVVMVSYPVMLTGGWYYVGFNELQGLAVVTVAGWLGWRSSWVWAGVAAAVLLVLRVEYDLLVVALVGARLVATPVSRRGVVSALARFAAGGLGGIAVIAAILAVRGEMIPYLQVIGNGLGYPQRYLVFAHLPTTPAGHLRLLSRLLATPSHVLPMLEITLLGVVGVAVCWWSMPSLRVSQVRGLATASVAVAVATGVVLMNATMFHHELEVIVLAAVLAMATLGAALEEIVRPRVLAGACALFVAVFCVIAAAGVTQLHGNQQGGIPKLTDAQTAWSHAPSSPGAIALNHVGSSLIGAPSRVTFARLGYNIDGQIGLQISPTLQLVCPDFAQYPFDGRLGSELACVRKNAPDLVLVNLSFAHGAGAGYTDWNTFLDGTHMVLSSEYQPVFHMDFGGYNNVTIWCRMSLCRRGLTPAQ